MYADDTSLSFASNNIDDLNQFMNEDLDCLKDWLQGNKLSLNVLKTHAMVVGSRPKLKRISEEVSEQPSFFINGTQIETVERTKYLGVLTEADPGRFSDRFRKHEGVWGRSPQKNFP